jgi:creatinine amidohydrolase
MSEAPIAWVPLGAIEFHAEHLPLGTDGFTSQALLERAARLAGGVVLPWSSLTLGTLHLPWSLRYDAALVAASVRSSVEQLAAHGARVVVVHTGHAPLDLIHLVKRICAEAEAAIDSPGFRAYGVCYLELNAALGAGLGTAWPVAVDHASITETSWMLAIEPDLVALERLPRYNDDRDDPGPAIVGVYGPNPRSLASAAFGEEQLGRCAALLAERAQRLLDGERIDTLADLRTFVAGYWPEPMQLRTTRAAGGVTVLSLRNQGPVSRYLTGLRLMIDDRDIDPAEVVLINPTLGEAGKPVAAASLGPEAGFYIRRGQTAEVRLTHGLTPGPHRLELVLGLAGVSATTLVAG